MTTHARRRRRGFTLVEILVVTVVIGLLATIAMTQLRSTRGRAIETSLVNDLRNLRTAQEVHVGATGSYSTNLATIHARASEGVTLLVTEATAQGWAATAEHPGSRHTRCALFVGLVSSNPTPATEENVIACD